LKLFKLHGNMTQTVSCYWATFNLDYTPIHLFIISFFHPSIHLFIYSIQSVIYLFAYSATSHFSSLFFSIYHPGINTWNDSVAIILLPVIFYFHTFYFHICISLSLNFFPLFIQERTNVFKEYSTLQTGILLCTVSDV